MKQKWEYALSWEKKQQHTIVFESHFKHKRRHWDEGPSGPLKQLYLFDSTEFKVQNQEREGFFFLNLDPVFEMIHKLAIYKDDSGIANTAIKFRIPNSRNTRSCEAALIIFHKKRGFVTGAWSQMLVCVLIRCLQTLLSSQEAAKKDNHHWHRLTLTA